MTARDVAPVLDPGSFRDPSGAVIMAGDRVFRAIAPSAWPHIDAAWSSGVLARSIANGDVIRTWPIDGADVPAAVRDAHPAPGCRWVEHEPVPFWSYPYEWPFSLLKRAALHHLDLHLTLLESGMTLSDASAYNIQFRGSRPVFIDVLSLCVYREGDYWKGYRQFCEQFLNPLLLGAMRGIPYNAWFRGTLEGIPVEDMARLVPWRARLSLPTLLHVILHARLSARKDTLEGSAAPAKRRPLPEPALVWMLKGLRRWIASLQPRGVTTTAWSTYDRNTSYSDSETAAKHAFVADYVGPRKPTEIIDFGCNTGAYSETALSAGAGRVIGLDLDRAALEQAVSRADARNLNLLPLFLDALNPSPSKGWAQAERKGFQDRAHADGLLGLALLHHIVIGRNVPLPRAVAWLASLARSGVIEFVPKADPMVQRMLAYREDIFPSYDVKTFRAELGRSARIVREAAVSSSGRTLFEYER
jgi:ribosomal protein L11 methylase PrmA